MEKNSSVIPDKTKRIRKPKLRLGEEADDVGFGDDERQKYVPPDASGNPSKKRKLLPKDQSNGEEITKNVSTEQSDLPKMNVEQCSVVKVEIEDETVSRLVTK